MSKLVWEEIFFPVFSWLLLFLVSAIKGTELLHPTIFRVYCLFKAKYSKIPRAVDSYNGFASLPSQQLCVHVCVCVCVCFLILLPTHLKRKTSEKHHQRTEVSLLWQTKNTKTKNQFQQIISYFPLQTLDPFAKSQTFNLKVVFP